MSDGRSAGGGENDAVGWPVVYDLSDWTSEQRAALDRLLAGEGLPHRWESAETPAPASVAGQLLVGEAFADLAEELIDEMDHPDALEVDDADDEGGAEILSELYVASDVLLGAPANAAAGIDARRAATAAATAVAPYGLDDATWAEVRRRAAALAAALVDDVGDADRVMAAAGALREVVRPLV